MIETSMSAASSPCGKAHRYRLGECLACRIAELERDLTHVARQRDEVAAKLEQAQQRIQSLTFGSNR